MKNLIKTPILSYALALSLAALQVSCSSDNKNTTSESTDTAATAANDGESAYTDYKNYVSTLDSSTIASLDTASTSWKDQRSMYDEKVARLDQYSTNYDENRRQEIDRLKTRYSSYWNSRGTNLSGGMAPDKVASTGANTIMTSFNTATISALSASAIREAYDSFVEKVRANKNSFTKDEWQKVEAYYRALDDRKDAVKDQISNNDKIEIAKAKAKYETVKTGEKLDPVVSQVAADVKQTGEKVEDKAQKGAQQVGQKARETGKDAKETGSRVADKVGTAAKNTAQDVTETGAKVGSKVGHAAKETGKDVKEGVVKGAKAVGKTADKAGEKVKDAFDGKKENE
ncbi:hypothetical protein AHMF7605_02355 [Adhaeribacter arboris]|uniref:DUF6565 domain-containing protein n=1 Tax=Adhaeribacter arboris TaxID=2072846 RepID=A0A2T2YAD3_9BACT|nr:DUF6565 domain-containing protein [Adhaeribacter arboris]PSR52446.1 hypothetical protein AHMF7605_02355 [Adhaeribacter arboris]